MTVTGASSVIECLICSRRCQSLGHHVRRAHGISADEYRDRHGIRRGEPLTAPATRQRFQDAIKRQIEAGLLDAHYATNAARGPAARARSASILRGLRMQGVQFAPARKPAPRELVEGVVLAIEAGEARKAAIDAAPISESAFYANLKRHPDLKQRFHGHVAARMKLKKSSRCQRNS